MYNKMHDSASTSTSTEVVTERVVTDSYGQRVKRRLGRLPGKFKNLLLDMWRWRLSYLFLAPFVLTFTAFTIVPVLAATGLSFTHFNAIERPEFAGWQNYQNLISQDLIFLEHVMPNTFTFSLWVGPIGFIMAFMLAWCIAQLPDKPRLWFTLALYAPSITAGVSLAVVWQVLFTGDRTGWINSLLLRWGIIDQPILFVTDPEYLLPIMIIVAIWSSMGLGFLAMLAGILNVDPQLYEAARIDGMSSRLQEIWFITIPMMRPQLLFAVVMAIAATLQSGDIGVQLSSQNPTPGYAGQLMLNHLQDFGFIRYELGYASAITVIMLALMMLITRGFWLLLSPKEDRS